MNAKIKATVFVSFFSILLLTAAPPDAAQLRDSARAALSSNRFAEAEQYYQELTKLEPDNPDAWHGLANSIDAQDRHTEADQAYLRAAELYAKEYKKHPSDSMLLYNLTLSTMCAGNESRAKEYAKEGIEKFPDDKNLSKINDLFNGATP